MLGYCGRPVSPATAARFERRYSGFVPEYVEGGLAGGLTRQDWRLSSGAKLATSYDPIAGSYVGGWRYPG